MNTLAVTCFIRSGALPFEPVNAQVGDSPAEHRTRALVDAVWVDATDGSKAAKVIAPGFALKVHAALALNAAPKSIADNRNEAAMRHAAAAFPFDARKALLEESPGVRFIKTVLSSI